VRREPELVELGALEDVREHVARTVRLGVQEGVADRGGDLVAQLGRALRVGVDQDLVGHQAGS